MARNNYVTTIAIDTEHFAIHFCSMIENRKETIKHYVKNYSGGHFDEEFFQKFQAAIDEFVANNPSKTIGKATVILPNAAVLTDAVKVPTMRGIGQTKKALDITLKNLYRNHADLKISAQMMDQNRQYSTFSIFAVQKRIVSAIYASCAEHRLSVETLTFTSGAAVAAVNASNARLKKASYLLMDIKDTSTGFVFVANGRAVGHYSLPFGLDFLQRPQVIAEDVLFDHAYAELAVLNARERAKAKKQLTMMALDSDEEEPDEEETAPALPIEPVEEEDDEEEADGEASQKPSVRYYTRKAPRKLPKFMRRDIPDTEEGVLYENFRVFVKWALTLIAGNEKLTELGAPKAVYVNIPDALAGVLARVNEEEAENGITFVQLPQEPLLMPLHLEIGGGFAVKHIPADCKF